MMQVHEQYYGFTVTASREVPELHATLWEMTYSKNGARLIWLEREDTNKTFAITFKTIPSDDTGVFHILEHSVLCGSDKYPVKEPFVELLKGSLNTFLNALTFPDKTMYPVSSRNDRDFHNLMNVYMDAVLHPAIYHKPHIFRQEGWHYAFEGENVAYNGVVFNEMKGAYAEVETVMYQELTKHLFPDNCYHCSSGGDPEYIPNLTYEQFIHCHQTYYHPSNAYLFLDGAVDIDATLALLDGYLCAYDALNVHSDIPMQTPVPYAEYTGEYEVAPDDDTDKVQLAWGYVYADYTERVRSVAMQILSDVLCGSNEAPLKKAILTQDLAEDVYFQSDDGTQQQLLMLCVRNVAPANVQAVRDTVKSVLTDLVTNGIDRDQLAASLSVLEFRARARDYGSYPRGIIYAMAAMESWLYGGDPIQNLVCDEVFAFLREQLDTGYFETVLDEALLHSNHSVSLCLTPCATLGEKKQQAETARIAAQTAQWSADIRAQWKQTEDALHTAQQTPDTPEQLATIPQLHIQDIPQQPEELPIAEQTVNGCTVLTHAVDTDGIVYADLYLSLADLTPDEIACASFLCEMLGNAATTQYGRMELQNAIRTHLGGFAANVSVFNRGTDATAATPYLVVSARFLESKQTEAVALIAEILAHSQMEDRALIGQLLRQEKLSGEESVTAAGHRYALGRVAASCSAMGVLQEYVDGLAYIQWIRRHETAFDKETSSLCTDVATLAKRIFVRERLTVSVTGAADTVCCRALTETVPDTHTTIHPLAVKPLDLPTEGVRIPSAVAYAVSGAHIAQLGGAYNGVVRVMAGLLSLDYLWNAVRVQGGAYGSGCVVRPNGQIAMYSYRDPAPARSLNIYAQAAAFLADVCDSDESIEPYIIGAVADTDPLLTPHRKGATAATMYFTGRTYADMCALRTEMLSVTKEQLKRMCAMLSAFGEHAHTCVVGGAAALNTCDLQVVRSLQEMDG